MKIAQSRITRQGQISVPAEIRRRLGLAPGSLLIWTAEEDQVVVRRADQVTSAELHRVLFPVKPRKRSLRELKEGIRRHLKRRHARH